MNHSEFKAIGLMSGTSLDGVDLVYSLFLNENGNWRYELRHAVTYPIENNLVKQLVYQPGLSANELLLLDQKTGSYLAEIIAHFIREYQLEGKVDLIASHGHTYYHRPEKGYTFQLGNGPEIYARTGVPTVCDFRRQDIALGGQGAPLVPAGDDILFGAYDACLNLGGFANISFREGPRRIAYDICPANIVLNKLSNKLGKAYDADGEIAASGKLLPNLLQKLEQNPFYTQKGPKSLGAEWVEDQVWPDIKEVNESTPDVIRTYTEHIAMRIADTLRLTGAKRILVTGGGAYNRFLIHQIEAESGIGITLPDQKLIDFKEALVFAFLGVLRILRQPNVYSSVTGASKDHCSGILYGHTTIF